MYRELLWIFSQLPDSYVVLDTETTGLPDEDGLPDIVTLGITVVKDRSIVEMIEFSIRPNPYTVSVINRSYFLRHLIRSGQK